MELVEFLRARLDEREAWAKAASQLREPGTPTGEHWHWECENCDTPITPNPVIDEFLTCPNCGSCGVGLRSVEEYPSSVGALTAFIVTSAEEIAPVAAMHLAMNDPAYVLADVAAKRRIVDEVVPMIDDMDAQIESEWGSGLGPTGRSDALLHLLAAPFADHPDFDLAWRVDQ